MQHNRHLRPLALLAAALIAFGATACGSNGGAGRDVASLDGSKAASKKPTDKKASQAELRKASLDFAKCMRAHGVDMPDPKISGGRTGGGMVQLGGPAGGAVLPKAKLDDAQKACQPIMDRVVADSGGPADPEQEAKARAQALAFSKCMRAHGVDMPDPQFASGGRVTQQLKGNPSDPNFQAAQKACAKDVGGSGMMFNSTAAAGSK